MTKIVNFKKMMAFFALVCLTLLANAAENDVCVQFGNDGKTKDWNVISMKSKTAADMINAKGEKTGITLKVTSKFSGVNRSGTKKGTEGIGIPATVSKDSLYGMDNNQKVHIEISGLNKDKKYKLTFYASRLGVKDNRETIYDVTGASTEKTALNVANNIDKTAEIAAVQPSKDGKISIVVYKGKNNNNNKGYFYLGALKLTEVK